ncbi:MAG: hypothetical protein ACK421_07675 [Pseudanabaenaceae cyanobacterium]
MEQIKSTTGMETGLVKAETRMEEKEYEKYMQVANEISQYTRTISISSKYYEFTQPGETVRGVFIGMVKINKRDGEEMVELNCVQWIGPKGELFLNAGAALVSTFMQFMPPQGCPVEITYVGKKDRTKIYEVKILTF